jgi:hypothetical protein
MHFSTKGYLKNNRYHTAKHPLYLPVTSTSNSRWIFKDLYEINLSSEHITYQNIVKVKMQDSIANTYREYYCVFLRLHDLPYTCETRAVPKLQQKRSIFYSFVLPTCGPNQQWQQFCYLVELRCLIHQVVPS